MRKSKKQRLQSSDLFKFTMVDDPQLSPDSKWVAWVKTTVDSENNCYQASLWLTHMGTGKSRKLLDNGSFPRWSPDGLVISYLASGKVMPVEKVRKAESFWGNLPQLYIVPLRGGKPKALTNLAGGVMRHGWSPDGKEIVFLSLVNPSRGLEVVPGPLERDLFQYFNRDVLVVDRIKWKSDSMGLIGDYYRHVVKVNVDLKAKALPTPVLLTSGCTEFESPKISPDGSLLAVVGNIDPNSDRQRREFIYLLNFRAKKLPEMRQLFGLAEMRSSDLAWSPDGKQIAVCGHNQKSNGHYGLQKLWIVSVCSGQAECVTEHLDVCLGDYSRNQDMRRYGGDDGPRWSADGEQILVLTNEDGGVCLASFTLKTKTLCRLTERESVVYAFAADCTHAQTVVLVTDTCRPCDLFVLDHKTKFLRQLTYSNKHLLETVELCVPKKFKAVASGRTIDGWIYPALGIEVGQKSPVILYTGGGPGGMRASVFCFEWQLYASMGYTVISCNARGNYGYGEAFAIATRSRWGDLDCEDNICFLNECLQNFDFMDSGRLAVAGGSYGGYLAIWIICHYQIFKAAVVDRCLYNRYSFSGTSDIGHLLDQVEFAGKLPWEAPELYLERSPARYISDANTPTLVVHSEQDLRCPVGQGEQLFMALKHLGVPTQLVRFPDETHELSRSGKPWHRIFRLESYLEWFRRYLYEA